jgi:predicted dehydrogenase
VKRFAMHVGPSSGKLGDSSEARRGEYPQAFKEVVMQESNRRVFLGTAAVAAGGLALGRAVHAQDSAPTVQPTLKLGVIGVGGYGMVNARAALGVGGVEITAICDVDSAHLEKNAVEIEKLQGRRPQTYRLYEEMLDKAPLEAVIIATPPQWHALQFIAAVGKGLDVYMEKPLAYDVREGRAMVDAARKSGRIVQIGFQRRQSRAFQDAAKFIAEGKAGNVVQVDAQIHYKAGPKDPTPKDPPPTLDWDLWCGPAPKIPYSEQVGHFAWRLEKTTGHGHLVDWGIHLIDTARMMLGLGAPKRVTADGGLYKYQGLITTPDTLTAHFEFDRCPVVWRHRLWGAQEYQPEVNNGLFFFGDEATVFATDNRWVVIPAGKPDRREEFESKTNAGREHMADFLQAVRERRQPSCPIEEGHLSTTTVQLGMIAYESATVVRWDAAVEAVADNAPAAALLKREYREPWRHPWTG